MTPSRCIARQLDAAEGLGYAGFLEAGTVTEVKVSCVLRDAGLSAWRVEGLSGIGRVSRLLE